MFTGCVWFIPSAIYLFYDAKTGNLYYDTDGTGEELAVKIALLGKNLAIHLILMATRSPLTYT